MPVITDVLSNDLPALLELQKRCYRENALRYNNFQIRPMAQTLPEIENEFARCIFLKSVEASEIIGSIRAYRTDNTCFIVRLFVHPEFQNRGIGSILITAIEQRFGDVDRYELFTGYRDDKNLYLYTKHGYTKFREERHTDGMIFFFLEKWRTPGIA
jgi:GNAT superfamily N-acetyltransferase